MIRIFLDTNILISGLYFSGNERKIINAVRNKEFIGCVSPYVLNELMKVLVGKFHEDPHLIEDFIERLLADFELIPNGILEICRDEGDNMVIGSAVGAGCNYLITGDKDLLELEKVEKNHHLNQ